jgi:cobalamin synthase
MWISICWAPYKGDGVSLRNALAYLTALRIPPRARTPLAHSLHYFPWVGAALGSLNILVFLAVSRILPAPIACLVAVLLPQALAGFSPWRGAIESSRGVRTVPGHGFPPGFRLDVRGATLAATLFFMKWAALMLLTTDWRVRAVFVFPIFGMCARTAIFLSEAPGHRPGGPSGPFAARRRIRAAYLSGLELFLAFQFPVRAALFILAAGSAAVWWTWRAGKKHGTSGSSDLTLQTAETASEFAEVAVLAGLVFAGLILFRW